MVGIGLNGDGKFKRKIERMNILCPNLLQCRAQNLEKNFQSHLLSEDAQEKFSRNFATAGEVLVTRATMLIAFASVMVAVWSPAVSSFFCIN